MPTKPFDAEMELFRTDVFNTEDTYCDWLFADGYLQRLLVSLPLRELRP